MTVPSERYLARILHRLAGLACVLLLAPAWSQGPASDAPVKPSGMDATLRRLVPADSLENSAAQQYNQLKQGAAQKRALAPDNHPDLIRLRAITQRMLPIAPRWNERARSWHWEVNLLGSTQVNAFCMPGGKIAVYSGLIKNLQATDDELAVVLGHEIAHALLEHSRGRIAKDQLTQLGATALSHLLNLGQIGNSALGLGANMLSLKFSRGDETEADRVGLELAARAGYDPRAGVTLWQKMERASGGAPPEWLSSHPAGNNRIREIEAELPRVLPLYNQASGAQSR
jgi:predicted Zn-dependent protease